MHAIETISYTSRNRKHSKNMPINKLDHNSRLKSKRETHSRKYGKEERRRLEHNKRYTYVLNWRPSTRTRKNEYKEKWKNKLPERTADNHFIRFSAYFSGFFLWFLLSLTQGSYIYDLIYSKLKYTYDYIFQINKWISLKEKKKINCIVIFTCDHCASFNFQRFGKYDQK